MHGGRRSMFRIKICGVTSVEDAEAVVRAGADAVGLNFYPKSPRYVALDQARRIVDVLPDGVVKVGVFVNAPGHDVLSVSIILGLDLIQLHGDEPPMFLKELGDRPVMRAFRLGEKGLEPVGWYLAQCRQLGCMPRLTLIDANVKGVYGGSGQVADWQVLKTYRADRHAGSIPPLVLAGGLTADNVGEAIRTVSPAAVDTASGVETAPGKKDPAAVEAFVRAARRAFDDV